MLSAQLEQTTNLLQDLGRAPTQVIVDLGYRGVDADNPGVQIIHRGKYKSLSDHEKKLLKRRQAIEPLIGHTKADHRMDRCWLQGAVGDALHALSCAAGYNIRWLLRVIARLAAKRLFYALLELVLWVRISGAGLANACALATTALRTAIASVTSLPVPVASHCNCARSGVQMEFAGPTRYWGTFGIMMAMRVPHSSCRLCSQAANDADSSSTSRKLSRLSMQHSASRLACLRKADSSRSGRLR